MLFEQFSVSELIERFDGTKLCVSHSCDAGANCSLFNGLADLRRRVVQIENGIPGLNLSSVKAEIRGEVAS
jgi:hypothetical protein